MGFLINFAPHQTSSKLYNQIYKKTFLFPPLLFVKYPIVWRLKRITVIHIHEYGTK